MSQTEKKTTKKTTSKSAEKQPANTPKSNKGQFVKGNTIGSETRFTTGNTAAVKYDEKYCDMILEYFGKPLMRVEYKENYYKGELTSKTPILLPNDYPTFELFAASIGVSASTLREWSKTYPRFGDCYARAKEMQFGKLTSGAVAGFYNPLYAKFEAVNNHGQSDRQEVDTKVTGTVLDDKDRALIDRVLKRDKAAKNGKVKK